MLEKNFTRKPYAKNEHMRIKILPQTVNSRPLVRNHKKRDPLVKRDPKTIFDIG